MTHVASVPSTHSERQKVEDFLAREYLPAIKQFPDRELQDSLLQESAVTVVCVKDASKSPPSAPVSKRLPKELEFLEGSLTDLGFTRLSLPKADIDKILVAFCAGGIAVPGTRYKLRHSVMSLFTFVEPATGRELMLPADWRQAVRSQSWIGKKVVVPNLDPSLYQDVGDGYVLPRDATGGGQVPGIRTTD